MHTYTREQVLAFLHKTYNALDMVQVEQIVSRLQGNNSKAKTLTTMDIAKLLTGVVCDERMKKINYYETAEKPIEASGCAKVKIDEVMEFFQKSKFPMGRNTLAAYLKLRNMILEGLIDKELQIENLEEAFCYSPVGSETDKIIIMMIYEILCSEADY